MKYRTLSLNCQCGTPSSRIREIGFTSDRQLVVHWRCSQCKSYVYGLKPLDDCFEFCPTEEELAEAEGAADAEEPAVRDDSEFLHDLGVKFPEEGEA